MMEFQWVIQSPGLTTQDEQNVWNFFLQQHDQIYKIDKSSSTIVNLDDLKILSIKVSRILSFTKKCRQNILEKKKWSINYRKELIQDKILRNVKKLLKAKKTNRLFVNLDLDPNEVKIFNDDEILNREIDLMRDENQDNFFKSLWGS